MTGSATPTDSPAVRRPVRTPTPTVSIAVRQVMLHRRGRAKLYRIAAIVGLGGAAIAWAQLRWGTPMPEPMHLPVVAYAAPMVDPVVVRATHRLDPVRLRKAREEAAERRARARGIARAVPGERMRVQFTMYCLRGRTRTGREVRPGIVAADPRVFPLGSYVELFIGDRSLGRYLVDDTGGVVKGGIIDIWEPDCREALRFGRRRGYAMVVPK